MNFKIYYGSTRIVIAILNIAIKIPYPMTYTSFLWGLIANYNEVCRYRYSTDKRLCPVIFALPKGFIIIMPRCKKMTHFDKQECVRFLNSGSFIIPAEVKRDSFGILNGRMVCLDYG